MKKLMSMPMEYWYWNLLPDDEHWIPHNKALWCGYVHYCNLSFCWSLEQFCLWKLFCFKTICRLNLCFLSMISRSLLIHLFVTHMTPNKWNVWYRLLRCAYISIQFNGQKWVRYALYLEENIHPSLIAVWCKYKWILLLLENFWYL